MTRPPAPQPAQQSGPQSGPQKVKLWDPLLRGFHWLLAFFVIAAWCLGKFGPLVMTLHFWCGYMVIALLAFRLLWGFVGPEPARFSSLVPRPRATLGYLGRLGTREPSYWHGHNPLGALSALAMLAALVAQVATGLIADPEDFINVGPLASKVGGATSVKAVGWHHLGATVIAVLVVLHLAAILYYRFWKREDLVKPMITGWKDVRRD